MPRFYCPTPLGFVQGIGQTFELPAGAARHVQVLRMQPENTLTLFDGLGGEYQASITVMGRSHVAVRLLSYEPLEREAVCSVTLALGVPANERMDWLVEKATELGVTSIQPLMTERGVLRLAGERAEKKQAHWQAIAAASCEQSGRNRLPTVQPVRTLASWLANPAQQAAQGHVGTPEHTKFILSLLPTARPLPAMRCESSILHATVLSGAEGGLSGVEEQRAIAAGFQATSLGNRVLRAETAALAALVHLAS
jgi:16S rRNA (uracil1498-N3)-methyltransferase